MKILLFVLAVLAFVGAGLILPKVQSAVHEIEALILSLIGAVFLCGAAIVAAIQVRGNDDDEPHTIVAAIQVRGNDDDEPHTPIDRWLIVFIVVLVAGVAAYCALWYFKK